MAKSGKHRAKAKAKAQSKKAAPVRRKQEKPPVKDYLERPAVETPADPMLRKVFWGVALAGLLVMIGLSFGTGVNADDKFQNAYSEKLVDYYSTFGQDTAALNVPDGNMHLYGGFF